MTKKCQNDGVVPFSEAPRRMEEKMKQALHRFFALAATLCLLASLPMRAGATGVCADAMERPVWRVMTDEKLIALTFDDGPHPYNTDAVLAVLAKYDIKATFFEIGRNIELYPDVTRRVVADGHELGNHTYHHPHLSRVSDEALLEELATCGSAAEATVGARPVLFRPPEGARTPARCKLLGDAGYRQILWSVDTNDWRGHSAEQIAHTVLREVKPGDIILMHDYVSRRFQGAAALETIIPALQKEGYSFVTVSELLGHGTPIAPSW